MDDHSRSSCSTWRGGFVVHPHILLVLSGGADLPLVHSPVRGELERLPCLHRLRLAPLSPDGSRQMLRHHIRRGRGRPALRRGLSGQRGQIRCC
ncbi:hypothetical protein LV779_19275 [Streptomyces thinghirensis]|nr:hypothetical protein [Streptomyces thinghirensis]